MQRKVQRFTIVAAASALAVFAADAWKTKDSSQWTSEEVTKVLTDSPWAKDKTVAPEGAGQQQRGRRGGMGGQGGGMGGGGIGFPGGGYPRAGGYPNGGGGGYPRGGGYPPGGGGYPNGGGGGYPGGGGGYPNPSMNLTIRWQSAAPVQEALVRQRSLSAEEAKALADASQKDYIITMVGFRMPNRRSSSRNIDSPDSNDQDRDSDVKAGSKNNDALRSRFLDAARLVPRGKSPIYAEDVQFEGPNGASEIRFMFPRNKEISADDKEVVFAFELEGIKFEHKFRLSDMSYQGKLAL